MGIKCFFIVNVLEGYYFLWKEYDLYRVWLVVKCGDDLFYVCGENDKIFCLKC